MTDSENDTLWNEYFYPGSNILINNFGVKNNEKLKELEVSNSFDRLLELRDKPLDMGYGKEQLMAIHKYIFEDVYPFAGKYRKVNMIKKRGTFLFMNKVDDIDHYLDELFEDTNKRMMFCHSKMEFCEILANVYTKLIYCHPFREGNGRAVREFVREFSLAKSEEVGLGKCELDWTKVNRNELNQFIEVSHMFPGATAILFMNALSPVESMSK